MERAIDFKLPDQEGLPCAYSTVWPVGRSFSSSTEAIGDPAATALASYAREWERFVAAGVSVAGISVDTVESGGSVRQRRSKLVIRDEGTSYGARLLRRLL